MIYVLLIGLLLELAYCYYVFNKDLFSPSAILCEVFILSTIACIFNLDKWGVDLSGDTVAVILGGNAVFAFVSMFIHRIYKRKHKNLDDTRREELKYINISRLILVLVTIAYLIFAIVYIRVNTSIMGDLNQSGDISQAMMAYRHEVVHEDNVLLPGWLTRINAIFGAGVYVLIYVFINNYIINRKKKSNYLVLLSIIAYLLSSVFTAQRTTILLAFIFAIFVLYSLLNRKYHFVGRLNAKYVFGGIIAVVIFLTLFGVTRSYFGRDNKESAIDNVTYYMGNSIESLDLFIKAPLSSKQFGEETFRQFRVYFSKYGLAEEPVSENSFLEFRKDANGNIAGNVYTGYRHYLYDFDYSSIILFQIMLALFFGVWYEKLRYRKLKSNIDLGLVSYAWFCLALFRFSITNEVFNKLAQFIFLYWLLLLAWKVLLNLRISIRRRSLSNEFVNGNIPKRVDYYE